MHWADAIARELLERCDEHRIATGISPSGHIHLGNLREMVTADAIRRALIDAGGRAEIYYIADDFDPLRRRYPFLPESYTEYVGMPLFKIPDPEGCHESYSEHFLQPFLESLEFLAIPVEVFRASEMYAKGLYEEAIRIALSRRDDVARIIAEVTGRELESDWYPFMPLCSGCGRINTTKVTGFDDRKIFYRCECGNEGDVSYKGGGKLTWRVDWAARWKILRITCEPFGKDHAAAGGSYDTGKRISREIFGYEPPYPVPYEWVHLKGVGAMKSSKGIVIPVREIIEAVPPEIIRYLFMRVKPERHIEFEPSRILEIFDDFEEKVRERDRSVELSLIGDIVYSDIPFRHIVVVGQIANWDLEKMLEIFRRTGYEINDRVVKDVARRMEYAKRWLERYAPENMRFKIADRIEVPLSEEEVRFLCRLAEVLGENMSAEEIHNAVYEVSKELGMNPATGFRAVYKVTLNKDFGPRAGYFIKSLGVEWFKSRVKELCRE
ncbi:MAG: lysine--tRNA ligase [Archaeoglobaceae archaeon]